MHFRIGCFIGACLSTTLVLAAGFSDIQHSRYQNAIEYLQGKGIIAGYADGSFGADLPVNRAELLKMLVLSKEEHPSMEQYHDCFPDVAQEWFAPFVCYAKEKEWVSGYPDGLFKPGQTVKTEEAIKMLIKSYGYRANQSSSVGAYADADPSAWYAPYMNIVKQMNIMDDVDNTIGIGHPMTRGTASDMMYRGILARRQGNAFHTGRFRGAVVTRGGGPENPIITFNDIVKTYGDSSFTLSALSNSTGHITYTSSDTSVATINGSTVSIIGTGSTTLTATQAPEGRFSGGIAVARLTVNGIAPTITFGNLTKSHIDANFTLAPTSNSAGAFTFSSGDTGLVTIAGSTADIVGYYGTTTISASQAASGNYAAGSASMTLTVFFTYCIASPCIAGTCVPTLQGALTDDNFICTDCVDGYSGTLCEEYADNCSSLGYCNSGECIPDANGGSCANCAPCLTGDRCQTAIINCEAQVPMILACVDPVMSRIY